MLKSFAAGILTLLAATFGPHQAHTRSRRFIRYQRKLPRPYPLSLHQCRRQQPARASKANAPAAHPESTQLIQQIADPFDSRARSLTSRPRPPRWGRGFGRRSTRSHECLGRCGTDHRRRVPPSQRINQLSNITVSGVSGLTSADIPDLSSKYLPLGGGTLSALRPGLS